MTARGFFVTGTDTGVGKTLAACALLHAFARTGKRVVGMKPVAAGATRAGSSLMNEDVAQLREASTVDPGKRFINPYCFESAIAPHIAAEQAGVSIDLGTIVKAYAELSTRADVVVVEGAGGFCVPLTDAEDTADLARRLALPVILVVGIRLGCMNHALLTAAAVRARGLELAGWIANRIDPAMVVADQNVAALDARLAAPRLGEFGYSSAPRPCDFAPAIDVAALL